MNPFKRAAESLPKPLLFGLYGALGGLAGALVLGEFLWTLLRPPAVVAAAGPPLRAAASPEVEVYRGESNRFNVKVARDGWDGPVSVSAVRTPAGLTVVPAAVGVGSTDAAVEVRAAPDAAVAAGDIELKAEGPAGDPPRRAEAALTVQVRARAAVAAELRLTASPELEVDQNGTNRFGVAVARDGFEGPVTVEVKGLPAGVTAAPLTIPPGATSGDVRVTAAADAAPGGGAMEVIAAGPPGLPSARTAPTARGRVLLKVRERVVLPPVLRLTVSPGVVVDQTGKNRFGVRVARDYFTGPVSLAVTDLPAGVTATSPVVPAGSDAAEIEIRADADAAVGVGPATVVGTGPGGLPGADRPPRASSPLKVTVNAYKPPELKVDVMFVLDVTGSMGFAIDGVRDGIIDFARELGRRRLDARVGLTGFRDHLVGGPEPRPSAAGLDAGGDRAAKKEAPRPSRKRPRRTADGVLFPDAGRGADDPDAVGIDAAPQVMYVEKQVFTRNFEAFSRIAGASLVADGGGDEPESSLDALILGACQPFRRDAVRVILLITDASPNRPDRWARSADDVREVLREAKIDQLHLVINPEHEPIYRPIQEAAGGKVFHLNEAAGNRRAFAALLPEISRTIARIAEASLPPPASAPGASPPPTAPAASRPPPLPPAESTAPLPPPKASAARDLAVAAAPAVLKGVQSQVAFAAASGGRLLLAVAAWTAAIAALIALALCAGQHYYLRASWLPAPAALRVTLGGLAAGLVGGAASQLLFVAAPDAEALFRVLGWTLLGGLTGPVLAFFLPNLRTDRGLLGGACGGAAGALGYLAAVQGLNGLPGGEQTGRVLGAVILGFFIGLMLALTERLARKAWLEIAYGGGETRTVNLGVEPVSIGSHSRAATIFARGAAPVAYRYWFLDGKVKCEDVAAGGVIELTPGASRNVGAVVVSVHTAASTAGPTVAPPPAPRATPPPPVAPPPVAPPPAPVAAPVPRPLIPPPARPASPAPATPPVARPAPAPPPVARPAPPPVRPAPPPARPAPPVSPPAPPGPGATGAAASGTCPGCRRPVSGPPGSQYCIFCDRYV